MLCFNQTTKCMCLSQIFTNNTNRKSKLILSVTVFLELFDILYFIILLIKLQSIKISINIIRVYLYYQWLFIPSASGVKVFFYSFYVAFDYQVLLFRFVQIASAPYLLIKKPLKKGTRGHSKFYFVKLSAMITIQSFYFLQLLDLLLIYYIIRLGNI